MARDDIHVQLFAFSYKENASIKAASSLILFGLPKMPIGMYQIAPAFF
jgi:hypothetical protein